MCVCARVCLSVCLCVCVCVEKTIFDLLLQVLRNHIRILTILTKSEKKNLKSTNALSFKHTRTQRHRHAHNQHTAI